MSRKSYSETLLWDALLALREWHENEMKRAAETRDRHVSTDIALATYWDGRWRVHAGALERIAVTVRDYAKEMTNAS